MQIRIDTFDLTPQVRGRYPVADISLNGARLYRTASGWRADTVEHFYQNNRETVLTFTVVRDHENLEDAASFCLTHEEEVPTKGTLELTMSYGAKTVKRWMSKALVARVTSRAIGITTWHTYEIKGGQFTNEPPTT